MKNRIAVVAALGALVAVAARNAGAVIKSPTDCATQAITSLVPVEITGNTTDSTTTAGVDYVKASNQDTSNDIFCSNDASVAISGSHIGDRVAHNAAAPWNWLGWTIGRLQKWYCIASTATVTTMVCKHKS